MSRLNVCLPLLLLASALSVHAADSQADLLAHLNAAHDASNLTDPSLKPWHLTATFDLIDPKGTVTERGTYEEWWVARNTWKVAVTSKSYTAIETNNDGKLYRTRNTPIFPEPIQILRREIENPIPAQVPNNSTKFSLKRESFGQVELDCITTHHGGESPSSLQSSKSFCLRPGQPQLRIAVSGTEIIERNDLGTFQDKLISREIMTLIMDHLFESAHVVTLEIFANAPGTFDPASDQEEKDGEVAGPETSNTVPPSPTHTPSPQYPDSLRRSHTEGMVLLQMLIDREGNVTYVAPFWSQDAMLTPLAVQAARSWKFKPAMRDGKPVSIQVITTINFSLASR